MREKNIKKLATFSVAANTPADSECVRTEKEQIDALIQFALDNDRAPGLVQRISDALVIAADKKAQGNKLEAAKILGIRRRSLYILLNDMHKRSVPGAPPIDRRSADTKPKSDFFEHYQID